MSFVLWVRAQPRTGAVNAPEEVAAVWAVCPGVPHPHVFMGSQHEFVSAKTRDTYLVSSFIHATGSFPFNPEKGKEKLNTFIFLKFQEKNKKVKLFDLEEGLTPLLVIYKSKIIATESDSDISDRTTQGLHSFP